MKRSHENSHRGLRRLWITGIAAALFGMLLPLLTAGPVHAAGQAESMLVDPEQEARLNDLVYELRCLVCQAESVAESHSDFADDIRHEVARMMKEGRTDQEIKDFLVARYGDFILFRPPMKSTTALLWYGPLLLLLIGAVVLGVIVLRRRRITAEGENLSEEEQRRAADMLSAGDDGRHSER